MSADELGDEYQKARYLATDQETRTFSQITSEEGRREFLGKFWSEVEAAGWKGPVMRAVYLQRVASANVRFRAMGRDGWRTDRAGLMIYAEPDEIERFPSGKTISRTKCGAITRSRTVSSSYSSIAQDLGLRPRPFYKERRTSGRRVAAFSSIAVLLYAWAAFFSALRRYAPDELRSAGSFQHAFRLTLDPQVGVRR